jgi:hypothetical protein
MDRLSVTRMVATRSHKLKLKLLSCKNNSNNLNLNCRLLLSKIRSSLSIFKEIREKLMLKELFVSKKKSSATFKEMKPINLEPTVKLISIESYHSWIRLPLPSIKSPKTI